MSGISGLGSFFGGSDDKNQGRKVVNEDSIAGQASSVEKQAAIASRRSVLSSDPLLGQFLSDAKIDQNTWINNTDRDLMSEFATWKWQVRDKKDSSKKEYEEYLKLSKESPGRQATILTSKPLENTVLGSSSPGTVLGSVRKKDYGTVI